MSFTFSCRQAQETGELSSGPRFSGDCVELWKNGRRLALQRSSELERVYLVEQQSALLHGDEPLVVLAFSRELWLLPDDTSDLDSFLEEIVSSALSCDVYRAGAEGMPLAWRKRLFGILPLFPVADLGVHLNLTLPRWTLSKRLQGEELERLWCRGERVLEEEQA